jgi:hypothetical protein
MDKHMMIAMGHILILAPALLYVAFTRANNPAWVYTTLLVVGMLILVYHGYRGFVRVMQKSPYAWVNLIHAFLIAPLLMYIGFNGRETPRAAYELLVMVGFAGLGYHLYSMITMIQIHDKFADGSK